MTCPTTERWHLLTVSALTEQEAAELRDHAASCPACRMRLSAARQDHTALLRSFEVFERDHDQHREQFLATLAAGGLDRERPRWQGGFIMQTLKLHRRIAALALLPAAGLVLILVLFLSAGPKVAFAAVLERLRQARSLVCDVTTEIETHPAEGEPESYTSREKLTMYADQGTRAWLAELPETGFRLLRTPDRLVMWDANGTYKIIKLTGPLADESAQRFAGPARLLEALVQGASAADRDLGWQEVDGRRAQGFEIAAAKLGLSGEETAGTISGRDPTAVIRLWVDPRTQLPVRVEYVSQHESARGPAQARTTWTNLAWDVAVDPQQFTVPAETPSSAVAEVKLDYPTEERFLEGLRRYAAMYGRFVELKQQVEQQRSLGDAFSEAGFGDALKPGYPARLEASWLQGAWMMRATAVITLETMAQRLAAPSEEVARDRGDALAQARAMAVEVSRKAALEAANEVPALSEFYHQLTEEGGEPEYFGQSVQPGDARAVLLRWKLDDQHWRVIYGDLHGETVPIGE